MAKNYVREAPRIAMADVVPSKHALDRALDMAVEGYEIRAAVENPRSAYISQKHEAWAFSRGRITVDLRPHSDFPGKWSLITVLWSSVERWVEDASVAPLPQGRRVPRGKAVS